MWVGKQRWWPVHAGDTLCAGWQALELLPLLCHSLLVSLSLPPTRTPDLCSAADDDEEKPAVKKPKTKPAAPAAAAAAPAPAPTPTAAPAGETPGGGTLGADVWTKKQGQDLVQLAEDEDQRKEVGAKLGGCW
jgi:hypothetical protein